MDMHFQLRQDDNTFCLDHGFLPSRDPRFLSYMPGSVWSELAVDLPKILKLSDVRELVNKLPGFALNDLQQGSPVETRQAYESAMTMLSFLAHAYIWSDAEHPASILPVNISQAWCSVAEALGRPPVLSYASYALYNWKRRDKSKPIELGNICLKQNFLGGLDEEWFILIHVDIEAKAIPALKVLVPLLDAAGQDDADSVEKYLEVLKNALEDICATMDRMPENCDPYVYYNRVRPFIHGWKDNPSLPDGLIYQGVEKFDNKPMKFKGETGAQSTIVPCLDAVLGIEHADNPLRAHLNEMRLYMPPEHLEYLEYLESCGSIRSAVAKWGSDNIKDLYNECLHLLYYFRTAHYRYAADYINKQSQVSLSNSNEVGTGGTPFMHYLKKHLDETNAQKL